MAPAIQIALLFLITGSMLFICLVPAVLEWLGKSDAEPLRVVREQDMSIRHFAASFRTQVATFFSDYGVTRERPVAPFDAVWHGEEPIAYIGTAEFPEFSPEESRDRYVNRVILGSGDMLLPGDMVFEQEVYCSGNLTTGDRTAFRALYAEQEISLGSECVIVRWLHCDGEVTIGERSQLYGRLSADQSVSFEPGCEFERVNAPIIHFPRLVISPRPARDQQPRELWEPDESIQSIDEATWKTLGKLTIGNNSHFEHHLIAKSGLSIGENVEIVGNLKADKFLSIGNGTLIRGAVVCTGPIEIGEGCLIKGPIISEQGIIVGSDCIVGAPALPTTVSAPHIRVLAGAQICGTLWAGVSGVVVDPEIDPL